MEYFEGLKHGFEPVYDSNSELLILGTFPSVKSREAGFYYYHPQNRFWKILAALCEDKVPKTIADKKQFLLQNRIAIWDVINGCDIIGSSDASIKNVVPADINSILLKSKISSIYTNGGKAYELYYKYCYQTTEKPAVKLPSSSPANAAWQLERLISEWGRLIRKV